MTEIFVKNPKEVSELRFGMLIVSVHDKDVRLREKDDFVYFCRNELMNGPVKLVVRCPTSHGETVLKELTTTKCGSISNIYEIN